MAVYSSLEKIIYSIGLFVALGFIIFSIDDVIWDIIVFIKLRRSGGEPRVEINRLDSVPPRLLAVTVAAWHEDAVIEPVIENMIASVQYPQSMYHIFLGVYPNDHATIAAVERLEKKYPNVHKVVNVRPGPTNKADNLNNIIRYISDFEAKRGWRFASMTVHDSEDVIHPYELKLTNYLIDQYDSLQFPVFPLQRMPSIKRFFADMTSGTYADEFAENHFRTLKMRDRMSAFVPSAGTGFVITRRILESYGREPVFPEGSLTEDYKLSYTFAKKGFRVHYVLEKVGRLTEKGKLKWDYVATRSIFPATFSAAVRQKTRWIYGITMQSIGFSEIFNRKEVSFVSRYTVYKDLKAKFGNLMVLPGYLVFLYFIASRFFRLPDMYPQGTFAWWLCVILTFMMVFRQTMRAIAIRHIYGFRSVIAACLFPPLMPLRMIWGNIINLVATIRAWKQLFFGIKKKRTGKVAWSKTDHEFLDRYILYRFHRNLGDVLMEKGYLDFEKLKPIYEKAQREGLRLGDALLQNNAVTEEQLMSAVAAVQHKLFIKNTTFESGIIDHRHIGFLRDAQICPILRTSDGYVIAETNFTKPEAREKLAAILKTDHFVSVFTTTAMLYGSIRNACGKDSHWAARKVSRISDSSHFPDNTRLAVELLYEGGLNWEQAVLALEYQDAVPDILDYMGLDLAAADLDVFVMLCSSAR